MATTRIKEKISAIVSSQLPEFIQSNYATFVDFIEAYYSFLEQDQNALEIVQNALSYNDIDSTTDAFVNFFLKNYAPSIPQSVLLNKRLLVKRINDLYESKGSELSFDTVFSSIFNTTVEVKYPFDFVLRASDGRWSERVSLRLRTVSGDRSSLLNRIITYTTGGIIYETPITEVKNLTTELTEVFLDKNLLAPSYTIGDTVQVLDGTGSLIFSGTIDPTIVSFSILRAGSGFKVGQIYNVSYENGVGTIIKITAVTSIGGISSIKIIFYGYGFNPNDTPFSLDFDATKNVSETSEGFNDFTTGFIENFNLTLTDPTTQTYFAEDYVPVGYTGNVLSDLIAITTVTNAVATIESKPAGIATLLFSLGALARYPGQFITENGFLSEPDVRLQDSLLYQPFSYQTNTDIDRETFFSVVKKLIHPAGQNLFNNRILTSNVSLIGNVSVFAESNISFEARDTVSISEEITLLKLINREFNDTLDSEDSNITFSINQTLADTTEPILDELSLVATFNRTLQSDVTPVEVIDLNYSDIQDNEFVLDSVTLLSYETFINNTNALLDSNISGVIINYAESGYFEEIYTSETVI